MDRSEILQMMAAPAALWHAGRLYEIVATLIGTSTIIGPCSSEIGDAEKL